MPATLESIRALREEASASNNNIEIYAKLVAEMKEYSESIAQSKESVDARKKEAEQKTKEAKAKIEAVKKRIEEKKAKAAAVAAEKTTAASSSAAAGEEYKKHIAKCGELFTDLALRKAAFSYVAEVARASPDAANGGSSNLRYIDFGNAATFQEEWATFDASLDKRLAELTAAQTLYTAGSEKVVLVGDVNPIPRLAALAEEVRDVHASISSALIRELSRRNNKESNVQQLKESQGQLMLWCRQQRSTMEGLTDAGQVQEYINSFQSNITVMETNFLVLMELAEPLLPSKEVSAMLEDVIEVWLSLQVFAFEKLTGTLLGQHEASGIEADLTRWLQHEGNVVAFLNRARDVLTMPVDDESREVTQPILEQCDKLLADIESFSIIASHLASFSLRQANLKEYYEAIRRTIFSKLTITTQVYNGQYSFPKKQLYMDRLAELNDWVDCKSQNGAWKQLLQRIDAMKTLIEENKATHGTAEERGY